MHMLSRQALLVKWFVLAVCTLVVLGPRDWSAQVGVVAADSTATITIDTSSERVPISPFIYGTNQDLTGTENWAARRMGGNRLTGYNWENNASNAGKDYLHQSDEWMCVTVPDAQCDVPGSAVSAFHDRSLEMGVDYSLVTLQMAGYVARDTDGPVDERETAPSDRWVEVQFAKGASFSTTPNATDDRVYMDEFVNFLVDTYGTASDPEGIRGYALDNEPALWPETHPRIKPDKPTYAELVDESVALSRAVKAVDADAEIFGPVLYGFAAYRNLQDALDANNVGAGYDWFIDYYLDAMQQASAAEGKRLLDVLDIHWYPEARGGGQRIVFDDTGNEDTQAARMQAPRTLWDPTYREDSWIATYFDEYLPLLPKLQESIDTYYPATKLAITEFSYGGEDHISGGIAMADALGIFGEHNVYLATYWNLTGGATDYVSAAYKLYRNYDANGAAYGNTSVQADTSDTVNSSVYAAEGDNGALHIIVLNKSFDETLDAQFSITSGTTYTSGVVWGFDAESPTITQASSITRISDNQFAYRVPPLTAYHIVLAGEGSSPTPTKPGGPGNTAPDLFLPLITIGSEAADPPVEPSPGGEVRSGEATYYDATGDGNCLFGPSPDDLMVAAMNHTDYNNAAMCGAYVEITGPDDTIMVRIVDRCPECPPGDIDLSREAFARIADPVLGRVPITWRIVSPELDGPIAYHFKEGSSQYWTAVQVRNHRNPIATFEYQTSGGQFKEVLRTEYNYFVEQSGMGPGPYTFRVTDIYGHTLTDSGIVLVEAGEVSGSAQFPPPQE